MLDPRKDILNRIPSNWEPIAVNVSYWQWEYDMTERQAIIGLSNKNLRLWVIELHEKSGIDSGKRYKELLEIDLGTIENPKIGNIATIIKPFSHKKSRAGWGFGKLWLNLKTKKEEPLTNIIRSLSPKANKNTNIGPYDQN